MKTLIPPILTPDAAVRGSIIDLTKRDRKILVRVAHERAMRKAFPNGKMLAPGEKVRRENIETTKPCTCGRTISANKEHCWVCAETLQRLRASFEAEGLDRNVDAADRAAWLTKVNDWAERNEVDLAHVYPDGAPAFAPDVHVSAPAPGVELGEAFVQELDCRFEEAA